MDSTTWKRAKQVFHEALERTGSERSKVVEAACGADRELRAQVEALLAAHVEAGEFLASPTAEEPTEVIRVATMSASEPAEGPGATIGSYKLLQVIGEGGFGAVYMAEQQQPVRRRVALKIIKLGMDTRQVIARFEAERQALALMEHPNIARVFDAGATETGRPYFVMELVKGVPITEYCDANRLSTRERLDLFVHVCGAVQHAHQKGVIHRDIKPSNVMVTLHDGEPVPKVIDFGIAKATHQRLTEKTLFTEYGQFIGTPAYMSPEQAEMSGLDVDTRSDIYSLGVLLYELLTGTTPFKMEELRKAGYGEIQRIIREEEPPKPSTRLSTLGGALTNIAKHRGTDPGGLTRLVCGDLDWIVMKALEKNRSRRYESASELGADIGRHLGDEPVIACPPSTAYRIRKFVRKHRAGVIFATTILATIVVLGSAVVWQARVAQRRAIEMQRQATQVRANSILASAAAAADPVLKALLIDEIADLPELPGSLQLARDIADHPLPVAVVRGPRAIALSHDGERIVTREGAEVQVRRVDGTAGPVFLVGHEGKVTGARFSSDGSRIVTSSEDGTARVWRVDGTGTPLVLAAEKNELRRVKFSPDGRLVAATSRDGAAWIWRANGTGAPIVLRVHESSAIRGAVFSPDSTRLATASDDGTARISRVDGTGKPIVLRHGGSVRSVEFGPDGSRVVTSGERSVQIWRADGTGRPIVLRHDHAVWAASFSPDGSRVVTAGEDGTVRVWRSEGTGQPILLQGHEKQVWEALFSPDGTRVLSTSPDGTARVWRADGAGEPAVLGWHEGGVQSMHVSADGSRVMTIGGGDARVWQLDASGEAVVFRDHAGALESIAFSPDGSRVLTGSHDNTSRIWRADGTGAAVVLEGEHPCFSPDGSRVVTTSRNGTARIWQADGAGEPVVLRGHAGEVWSAAFSPDGTRLVTASQDGTARVWRTDGTGEPVVLKGHDAGVTRVVFTPDGTRVVAHNIDGSTQVWSVDGKGRPVVLPGPEIDVLRSFYFIFDSRDALLKTERRRVVNAYWDPDARVWRDERTQKPVVVSGAKIANLYLTVWSPEIAVSPDSTQLFHWGELRQVDGTGEPVVWTSPSGRDRGLGWSVTAGSLPGYQGHPSAAFSPDGTRVLATSIDGAVRVWRTDVVGKPIELWGHKNEVYHGAFSPDGKRIVSGSIDYTARVWNADGTGEPLVLRGFGGAVIRVAFSPDGTRVAAASWDGSARVWRVTWPGLLTYLRENLNACLTPEQRERYLADSSADAWDAYAACERRFGRSAEREAFDAR